MVLETTKTNKQRLTHTLQTLTTARGIRISRHVCVSVLFCFGCSTNLKTHKRLLKGVDGRSLDQSWTVWTPRPGALKLKLRPDFLSGQ